MEHSFEYELYWRHLEDGRVVVVLPLIGGRARVHIGPDEPWFDDGW